MSELNRGDEARTGDNPNASTHRVSDPDTYFNRPNRKRRRFLAVSALLALFALWLFVPAVYRLRHGPVVVTRWDRKAGETQATVGPGLKGWISAKKISRHALHAIVAAEDGKFYEHHGFDYDEIKRSYELNKKRKRYARGASTISQQVVKMAFLSREKSLIRKAREAAGTALMELILTKEEILEWYINLAEFGDGVYGIQEGCWHYFKTKPELLSIEQSVHLALVLPSPNAWSRGLKAKNLTPFGHRRYASILNRMRQMGFVTRTQWVTAVTRGDFGRPIRGYSQLLAAEENHAALCPGNPGCPDVEDEAEEGDEELTFPKPGSTGTKVTDSAGITATATATATTSATSTSTSTITATTTVKDTSTTAPEGTEPEEADTDDYEPQDEQQ